MFINMMRRSKNGKNRCDKGHVKHQNNQPGERNKIENVHQRSTPLLCLPLDLFPHSSSSSLTCPFQIRNVVIVRWQFASFCKEQSGKSSFLKRLFSFPLPFFSPHISTMTHVATLQPSNRSIPLSALTGWFIPVQQGIPLGDISRHFPNVSPESLSVLTNLCFISASLVHLTFQ